MQLEQIGLRQGKLHPCAFADATRGCWAVKHVDDGVIEGKPDLLNEIEAKIGEHVLLKKDGRAAGQRQPWRRGELPVKAAQSARRHHPSEDQ